MGRRPRARTLLTSLTVAAVTLSLIAAPVSADDVTTAPAPSMAHGRFLHTTSVLPDGDVLVVGGRSDDDGPIRRDTATVERFDVATGTWSVEAPIKKARSHHIAVTLRDGDVLVIGGWQVHAGAPPSGATLDDAERYDVDTRTWTWTRALSPRFWHAAVVLGDGRVLVSGGERVSGRSWVPVRTAELYDPMTDRWMRAADPPVHQLDPFATLLPDGRAVFLGGRDTPTIAQAYDPRSDTWTVQDGGWFVEPRRAPASFHVRLPDDRVLRVGGVDEDWEPIGTAEVLDLRTMTASPTGFPIIDQEGGELVVLPGGDVLLAGGWADVDGRWSGTTNLQRWDASTGTWSRVGSMAHPRTRGFTAAPLPDGSVLLAGGYEGPCCHRGRPVATAELYRPG